MKDYDTYFKGYTVPENIKNIAVCIMKRFTITGLCDGMYICNVIATENLIGNGKGDFTGSEIIRAQKTAETLQGSYGCNIYKEDIRELYYIISDGKLDIKKSMEGLKKIISKCKEEKLTCDSWRIDYLDKCIAEATETLTALR